MSPAPAGVEREIKLPVPDLDEVRLRLQAAGAELVTPNGFERNQVFDRREPSSQETLRAAGRLLRLRQDAAGVRLTYKGVARFERGAKIREERELVVDDAATAERLLAGLGFRPVRRYEKWRETWRLERVAVTLDRTPIGSFVELESLSPRRDEGCEPDRDLEDAAEALGLELDGAEPRSYLALYDAWRTRHPDAPVDMVFEARAVDRDRED